VKESKFLQVTTQGKIIEGLKEEHYKVLEWENVGIIQYVGRKVRCIDPGNHKLYKNPLLYAVLLSAIFYYLIK
jgi:hypothetical protein